MSMSILMLGTTSSQFQFLFEMRAGVGRLQFSS
jgi:hypothetical protein